MIHGAKGRRGSTGRISTPSGKAQPQRRQQSRQSVQVQPNFAIGLDQPRAGLHARHPQPPQPVGNAHRQPAAHARAIRRVLHRQPGRFAGAGDTGARNSTLAFLLQLAIRSSGLLLKLFDSSTGFCLGDGSVLSPDAALVNLDRWQALDAAERRGFPPLCPDLVVELASPSDDGPRGLTALRRKLTAYQANGARRPFGWGAPVSGAGDRSGGDLGGLRGREGSPLRQHRLLPGRRGGAPSAHRKPHRQQRRQ
jgi:hypothetical protein